MWLILVTGITLVSAIHPDSYSYSSRNQRLIKHHSSPYKHHPHHKHIRPGPLGPHIHYHDNHDHHYEYIRPNRPPPIPPFVNGPPSSSPLKYHSRPPSFLPYKSAPPFGSSYKPNSFRSPIVKEHFRSPPIPSAPVKPPISYEYLPPSKPSSLNHIINSDDDRGPIHEIPAPNLGPKPDHILDIQEQYHHELKEQFNQEQNSLFNSLSKEPSFNNLIKDSPTINFDKKPSYEVVETNDKVIQKPDGTKALFAPDPDPSLPAPKVPPTKDPHSLPTKTVNENFPTGQEYQILEATPNYAPVPNLSSQELFDLMHSFPNDEYTVIQSSNIPQHLLSVINPQQIQYQNQPQIVHQQNFIQPSTQSLQLGNSHSHNESPLNHIDNQQYHDFNHPQYQSFNYDERNHNAGAVPVDNFHGQFMFDPEASETDNSRGSVTVVRNTDQQTDKGKQSGQDSLGLPSDLTNLIPDDDFEKDNQDQSPIFKLENNEVPFYSSLPNKQAAEALATLQAAGSIATNIKKLRGDQAPEKGSSEELVNFGLPKAELTKPQQIHAEESPSYDYEEEQQSKTDDDRTVEVQKSIPLYEASYKSSSLASESGKSEDEILASLDVGQGAASEKFGRRIRPK